MPRNQVIYAVVGVLVTLWLLGLLLHVGGDLVHIMLVAALSIALFQVIVGKRE